MHLYLKREEKKKTLYKLYTLLSFVYNYVYQSNLLYMIIFTLSLIYNRNKMY